MAMRIGVGMHTIGDKLLERGLRKLEKAYSPRAPRRILKRAIKAGGAIIAKAAKRRAPKDLGNLKRSLMVSKGRVLRVYRSGTIVGIIGPSWPGGAHGNLVESGTVRRATSSGANRGTMPAQPFLEPAHAATKKKVAAKMRDEIKKGLAREWTKYFKKRGG